MKHDPHRLTLRRVGQIMKIKGRPIGSNRAKQRLRAIEKAKGVRLLYRSDNGDQWYVSLSELSVALGWGKGRKASPWRKEPDKIGDRLEHETFMYRTLHDDRVDHWDLIDSEIQAWKKRDRLATQELHEWLGMTKAEMLYYESDPWHLESIVEDRRTAMQNEQTGSR
jgi:hypothetical protein